MASDDEVRGLFREFFQDLDEREKIKNDIAVECQDVLNNVVLPTLRVLSEENTNKRVKIIEDNLSIVVAHDDGDGYDRLTFHCRGREFNAKFELAGHSYPVGSNTKNLSVISREWVAKEINRFLGEALKSRKKIHNS